MTKKTNRILIGAYALLALIGVVMIVIVRSTITIL